MVPGRFGTEHHPAQVPALTDRALCDDRARSRRRHHLVARRRGARRCASSRGSSRCSATQPPRWRTAGSWPCSSSADHSPGSPPTTATHSDASSSADPIARRRTSGSVDDTSANTRPIGRHRVDSPSADHRGRAHDEGELMKKQAAALFAASALIVAACGSDDGDSSSDDVTTDDSVAADEPSGRRTRSRWRHRRAELDDSSRQLRRSRRLRRHLRSARRGTDQRVTLLHTGLERGRRLPADSCSPTSSAGTAPDVFWIPGTDIADFAKRGVILDLREYADAAGHNDADFYPGPMAQLTTELATGQPGNALWGLPRDVSTFGLYVNLDLIAEAGARQSARARSGGRMDLGCLRRGRPTASLHSAARSCGYGQSNWWGPNGAWINAAGGGFFNDDADRMCARHR